MNGPEILDKYIGEAPLHPSHSSRAGVARACFELHARHRTGPLQVSYGRIHGFGTYTWRTNSKYVGCWKEGKMHGHGVKTDPHGNLCASALRLALRLRPAPPPCATPRRCTGCTRRCTGCTRHALVQDRPPPLCQV